MKKHFFVKQNHRNTKIAFILLFLCLFIVVTIIEIENKQYHWEFGVFLFVTLILFIYLSKLFDSYGIYIMDEKLYYKTVIKKEVDINIIVAIKIIKSEGQVNLAWSPFTLKDRQGNTLYSMICLSKIEDEMKNYPYGDIEFINKYKGNIVFYSIYDETLIKYLKRHKNDIKILNTNI